MRNPFDNMTLDTGNELISKMAAEMGRYGHINISDWQQPEGMADNHKDKSGPPLLGAGRFDTICTAA